MTVVRRIALGLCLTCSVAAGRAGAQAPATSPPLTLVQPDGQAANPVVMTLLDAIERARSYAARFQASVADATMASEDRIQARASLLPSFSHTTQYLGTQGDTPLKTGRFVSNDGVHVYRSWLVAHEELSANMLTPIRRATAADALAEAKLEIARRGLTVTVTQQYYALVTAERTYAAAQQAEQQAQRFFEMAQQQQRLGQVARADVVKAEIHYRQQEQAGRNAALQTENARLQLSVLLFPSFNQNFTVVDDLTATPALPPFPEVRTMAEHDNPDLRAASAALRVAEQDVSGARNAFLPTVFIDADYGIEANAFALHSRVAADPELGVLPNLGYFVTVNLSVPIWDWGGLRSKLHQSRARATQAQVELTQTQREAIRNLYVLYNEALAARDASEGAAHIADLASESLRLTNLRYQAGESTALEVVDAQNTRVQARDAYDAALMSYRIAIAELQTLTGDF
jgi:outer membrane protein TolC